MEFGWKGEIMRTFASYLIMGAILMQGIRVREWLKSMVSQFRPRSERDRVSWKTN